MQFPQRYAIPSEIQVVKDVRSEKIKIVDPCRNQNLFQIMKISNVYVYYLSFDLMRIGSVLAEIMEFVYQVDDFSYFGS
jgi:hypothetical protein